MCILHPASPNDNNFQSHSPVIKTRKLTVVQSNCCTFCEFHQFSSNVLLFQDLLQNPTLLMVVVCPQILPVCKKFSFCPYFHDLDISDEYWSITWKLFTCFWFPVGFQMIEVPGGLPLGWVLDKCFFFFHPSHSPWFPWDSLEQESVRGALCGGGYCFLTLGVRCHIPSSWSHLQSVMQLAVHVDFGMDVDSLLFLLFGNSFSIPPLSICPLLVTD